MKNKVSFEVIPVNKFGYLLEEETAGLNEKERFVTIRNAEKWLKINLNKFLYIITNTYKGKMLYYSGFEIRILKSNKLKKRFEIMFNKLD